MILVVDIDLLDEHYFPDNWLAVDDDDESLFAGVEDGLYKTSRNRNKFSYNISIWVLKIDRFFFVSTNYNTYPVGHGWTVGDSFRCVHMNLHYLKPENFGSMDLTFSTSIGVDINVNL